MAAGASSWSFTEDDYGAITDSLQRFLGESQARCALLVDRARDRVSSETFAERVRRMQLTLERAAESSR